jgi:large subunit ribosomal protein L6
MSRIGKKLITIPKDVSIKLENQKIIVKGKYGVLERTISNFIQIVTEENKLFVHRLNEEKKTKESHGLTRALLQNMITGVDQKFSKILIAEGVGYKFLIEKEQLVVNVGYSHPITFKIPEDITIKLESNTKISLVGIDKEKIGFLASEIRSIRPPEPYKGKGIMYEGEKIRRKAGKTGK